MAQLSIRAPEEVLSVCHRHQLPQRTINRSTDCPARAIPRDRQGPGQSAGCTPHPGSGLEEATWSQDWVAISQVEGEKREENSHRAKNRCYFSP